MAVSLQRPPLAGEEVTVDIAAAREAAARMRQVEERGDLIGILWGADEADIIHFQVRTFHDFGFQRGEAKKRQQRKETNNFDNPIFYFLNVCYCAIVPLE